MNWLNIEGHILSLRHVLYITHDSEEETVCVWFKDETMLSIPEITVSMFEGIEELLDGF